MFATLFVSVFVAVPLSMTLMGMFRRAGTASPADDPLPRYTMRDFRRRDDG